jgi:integrase
MARLEERSGIHCNPHKLRHTFATRCVDKGVPMFHLQDALGHRSLDMTRRYYTANSMPRRKASTARSGIQGWAGAADAGANHRRSCSSSRP